MKLKSMMRNIRLEVFVLAAVFWAVSLIGCDNRKPQATVVQAARVTAMTVKPMAVPVSPSFVAEIRSSKQVDIVARVNGFLEHITYREGSLVEKGDVLFRIDPRPFQARLAADKAEVERGKAEQWIAKVNLDRIRSLAQSNVGSKSDLDDAIARLRTAEAVLAQMQASVRKTELDLDYTTIRSPFRGIAGEALVSEGAYLTAGAQNTKLTSVILMNPVWVQFSVTQNQFLNMRDEVARGALVAPKSNAYDIEVEFSDGKTYPLKGRFNFAEPTFNPKTGTFIVRAQLPNPDGDLLPGMFVRARVKGAVRPDAIVIPQKAVQQTANGHIVYVANDKNVAEIRQVVAGEWIGQDWVIDQGLKAGDRVIIDGFQRLAPGAPVVTVEPRTSPETAAPVESK